MICAVNRIKKNIAGQDIFNNLSIDVREQERVALVGPNGCGKSTLLKMIIGSEKVDGGEIHIKKGAKMGLLEQIPSADRSQTGLQLLQNAFVELNELEQTMKTLEEQMATVTDNDKLMRIVTRYGEAQEEYEKKGGYEKEAKMNQVIEGLGLAGFVDHPFQSLSGGEQTKMGLAVLLLQEPDLLLLDEPTNHLDLSAMEWLEGWLIRYKGAVVIVSHDRHFLDRVVTKIYDLDDEEALPYHGNYTYYINEREERLLLAFSAYQEQQRKIKKMKAAIKRLKEWANSANPPNDGLHRRAKSMEKALEKMEKLDRPKMEDDKMKLSFQAKSRSGDDLVQMEDVSFGYDPDQLLFENVHFHLRRGERASLVGLNGAGKSTFLKLITGECEPLNGKIKLGSQLKVGYLSQHLFNNEQNITVLDAFREEVAVTEENARHILAKFLFFGASVFKKVHSLSGGERMRLRLAQFMHQDINLLILDEPTNHLDIVSREALEDAILQFNGTILAVSHDRWFLNRSFETTYFLDQRQLFSYSGNYDYAKAKHFV
ncbi:MAG TPA: ABC-F type ribosomal protection protein [Sporolactobacillaceae bacterium]|nr:ABC-F type ribosomal protection protein [Sporolactobacillaceae bacterium]